MNKQEMVEKIETLPIFEKRDVYLKEEDELHKQRQDAICEVEENEAYAYVSKDYNLIQFGEVFKPIIESIESEATGSIAHQNGFAIMKVFPEMESLKEENNHFGLMAMNSVDRSCSIIIKFVVERGGYQFTIPPKVAGLKKQHTGSSENIMKNYISMIGKVKEAWRSIVTEFPEYRVVLRLDDTSLPKDLEFGTVVKRLKIGNRLAKKLKDMQEKATIEGERYSLWDLFMDSIEIISDKDYKSDVTRERKIDNLCQAIFEFKFMIAI